MEIDKRTVLMQSAVRSIAKNGMMGTTTRSISREAGLNDAYIYRLFENKEDLMAQAYLMEAGKLLNFVGKLFESMNLYQSIPPRMRVAIAFHAAWRYTLDTPDICRLFSFYWYSPSFGRYAQKEHERMVSEFTEKIAHTLFPSFEDARSCMLALFALINSFAIGVVNGVREDSVDTEQMVFGIVYSTLQACMHPDRELPYDVVDQGFRALAGNMQQSAPNTPSPEAQPAPTHAESQN